MVPEGWVKNTLDQFASIVMGETLIAKDLTGDGLPVFSANKDTKPWGWTSHSRKKFKRGTIIVGARGTIGYPRLPDFDEYISTQTTIAVRPNEGINPLFLYYAIDSKHFAAISSQQAVPMLTVKALGALEVCLPLLPEQKKIAAILGSVDEAIQATQAIIDQTRKVKQGLLQQLLTRGIGHTRFKQTEIGEIPEGWEVVRLGDVLPKSVIRNGLYKPAGDYGSGTPIIRIDCFDNGSHIRETPPKRVRISTQEVNLYQVQENDILINRVNSLSHLGKSALVMALAEDVVFESNLMCLRVPENAGLLSRYLLLLLSSEQGRRQVVDSAKMAIAQCSISQKDIFSFRFPLPSVAEQKNIVQHIHEVGRTLRHSERELAQLRQLKGGLMQDLLTGRVRVGEIESVKAVV